MKARNLLSGGMIAALVWFPSFAHDGAMGVVKERMEIMSGTKDAMKLLSGMANGAMEFDAVKAADTLNALSEGAHKFPTLFHEGTGAAPSEASPAIWTDGDKFGELAVELAKLATAGAETLSAGGDTFDLEDIVSDLGETCKSCHKQFRIKR